MNVEVALLALENVPVVGVAVHVPVIPEVGAVPESLTGESEQTWVSLPTIIKGICCNTVIATLSLAVSTVQALANSKIYKPGTNPVMEVLVEAGLVMVDVLGPETCRQRT